MKYICFVNCTHVEKIIKFFCMLSNARKRIKKLERLEKCNENAQAPEFIL